MTTDLAQTAFSSLGWFRSPRSLDWMEKALSRLSSRPGDAWRLFPDRRGAHSQPGWLAGAPSRSSPSTPSSGDGAGEGSGLSGRRPKSGGYAPSSSPRRAERWPCRRSKPTWRWIDSPRARRSVRWRSCGTGTSSPGEPGRMGSGTSPPALIVSYTRARGARSDVSVPISRTTAATPTASAASPTGDCSSSPRVSLLTRVTCTRPTNDVVRG